MPSLSKLMTCVPGSVSTTTVWVEATSSSAVSVSSPPAYEQVYVVPAAAPLRLTVETRSLQAVRPVEKGRALELGGADDPVDLALQLEELILQLAPRVGRRVVRRSLRGELLHAVQDRRDGAGRAVGDLQHAAGLGGVPLRG